MVAKIFALIDNLTDNDTLILIFVFVLAMMHPAEIKIVIGGMMGYMGAKVKVPQGGPPHA